MNRIEGIQKLMGYVEEMRGEGINVCRPQFKQYYLVEMMLISKHYPLVKRLVDNDKIEESKIEIHWFSFYKSVLMELSIQDEPIEFLISILK